MLKILELAEQGESEAVMQMVEGKADPNMVDADGWSPLIMAAKGGHDVLLGRLLDAKAQPNPGAIAHTALRGAAINGHCSTVSILLAAKADPNLESLHSRTPLMGCARAGHLQVARVLIEAGADVSRCNSDGEDALFLARANGHTELAAMLEEQRPGA
uniref:Uncharacterized protein n=1 Tax=Hemiselmis andersenii TaxID=464988 RepID=A0A6U4U0C1_HEMAN|mmetsp:Transcript_27307/g.63375  ORF Transcript_27307/g.63375 Transcript_27307/m.63375 type:complete len:158 (-) Transcript_27307:362-835(-)